MIDPISNWLERLNFVLTMAFVVEMVVKLAGLGIKQYDAPCCPRALPIRSHIIGQTTVCAIRQVLQGQVQRV